MPGPVLDGSLLTHSGVAGMSATGHVSRKASVAMASAHKDENRELWLTGEMRCLVGEPHRRTA